MNDRDRILALFAGDVPDRVPWFADLAYWATSMAQRGLVPPGWQSTADYYRFHRDLGVGFYLQGYFPFRPVQPDDVQITESTQNGIRYRAVSTPLGVLREQWRFLPIAYAWAPAHRMVSSPSDLRALRYWCENTRYVSDPTEADRRRPWLCDLGIVLCYLPRSPFMELAVNLAGIANVVELWLDARDELEETLRAMCQSADRAAEAALSVAADCYMIPENLSSECIGQRFYQLYVREWEEKWVQRIHDEGKCAFIHMDGTLRGLLSSVASAGFDVIEAVTPMPVGDVSIQHLRALAGRDTILWGGIPGVYFTALVSDQEFDRHVREVLDTMVADKRMVLGAADQVPPDGLRSRVARVADLVRRHGHYPRS